MAFLLIPISIKGGITMGNAKTYQKLIVLEPDDFETKIVDEVNYPLTKEGQERLNQRMEVYND